MKHIIKRIVKTVTATGLAAGLAFAGAAAPAGVAYAAELTAMDRTAIADDLADIDLSAYGKNENGRHTLVDGAGFMEYAYSSDATVSAEFYGLYFYVYNPTERAVSTRAGANTVNMAVEYDAAGEPAEYENCGLTLLDHTENHRFYKFKLTNSAGAYDRARAYAAAHGGVRRYDIAGIQLWFAGDGSSAGETDGEDSTIARTYTCTGYCAGCAADENAPSTLEITCKTLETIKLDVQSTWYRTGVVEEDPFIGREKKTTLSSVYFSIPNRYIADYGNLQIVKCEWYEYKTNYMLVTSNEDAVEEMTPYLGYELPLDEDGNYHDGSIPFGFFQYLGPSSSGIAGVGWNHSKSQEQLQRYDWLFEVDDIADPVPDDTVQAWAENYPIYAGDDVLTVGARQYNANLFSDTVDAGHVRGYNVRTFDARDESQWIDLRLENQTSAWDQFLNMFLPSGSQTETWLEANDVIPIEEIGLKQVTGNDSTVSNNILVDEGELEDLRAYVTEATAKGEKVYILRFSTSDYDTVELSYTGDAAGIFGKNVKMYGATDTVYLAFDIIHLGFVRGDDVTIIPVVADPIDIYPEITPPERLSAIDWVFISILCAVVVGCILGLVLTARMDGGAL